MNKRNVKNVLFFGTFSLTVAIVFFMLKDSHISTIAVNEADSAVEFDGNSGKMRPPGSRSLLARTQSAGKQVAAHGELSIDDIYIGVKTTQKNHKTRLKLQLDTWAALAPNSVFYITDKADDQLEHRCNATGCKVVVTPCKASHERSALVCKTSMVITTFIAHSSRYKWMCIIDDDNYVLVENLVRELEKYDLSKDWYLGKQSWPSGFTSNHYKMWFTTGGAGTCINKDVVLRLQKFFRLKAFQDYSNKVKTADDCILGYIMNHEGKVNVTTVDGFHSHLEPIYRLSADEFSQQSILSYSALSNFLPVTIVIGEAFPSFSERFDPTRLRSLHCYIYPDSNECKVMMQQAGDYKLRKETLYTRFMPYDQL